MKINWTTENMRRMINEGRVFDSQSCNYRLAHNVVVKAIVELADRTSYGLDGEGFASSQIPRKVRCAVRHARINGKLYGRPFHTARGYCLKHAKQLAQWANEKQQ
jgi:hypothetical protein